MTPGEGTRTVHGPAPREVAQRPLVPPVHRSTTFVADSAQQAADVFAGRAPGWTYSRTDNPTAAAFADAVAALEGGQAGQAFASGMAAISTTVMALTGAGARVVAPRELYGGTWSLLVRQLGRFGVATELVDMTDLRAVQRALPGAALLWGEVMANPTMTVADLPGLSGLARQAGVLFAVDATFASPAICRPIEHGADLVVHSATKYLGGHSDATGGVVVGPAGLVERIGLLRHDLGGSLAPDEAALLSRGLQTLPLRVARQCGTALAVARALLAHPAVAAVDYPGLPGHRSHDLALALFDPGRYGAVVTVTPNGGQEAGMALVDGLQLVQRATSLGGTVSKAVHVATTTHQMLDEQGLRAAGIDPGAVRVSIGLEEPEDLVADLARALAGIAST